jgi:hypothetical protein
MKYVKKAIEIEAIQWNGENLAEIFNFCGKSYFDSELKIITLEGIMNASVGDFIIKGIKGEFYPCKEEIFNLSYDLVEEDQKILSSFFQKTLHNTTANGAKKNVKDIVFFGDGDTFKLISKASSENEGWMKSTKAMEIEGVGCVVQVTTQQRNPDDSYSLSDAVTFVPNAKIDTMMETDGDNEKVVGRKLININQ